MSRSKISTRRLKKINYNGKLLKNFDLSGLTTFKCGGKCSFYLEINTLENFLSVIFYIAKIKIKYFVLGAGSNVLVSDNGFDGVVIKLGGDFDRIEQLEDNLIECGAGCNLTKVISQTIELGLGGLECGVGIPATIGGAVFMNAGAYDFEMSKVVDYVVAFVDG